MASLRSAARSLNPASSLPALLSAGRFTPGASAARSVQTPAAAYGLAAALAAIRACTSGRLSGGNVAGGCLRGGSSASRRVVAAAISATARSMGSRVLSVTVCTPDTLRTYCSAAAWISSAVAAGSSPRSAVMFRHMSQTLRPAVLTESRKRARSVENSSPCWPIAQRYAGPHPDHARSSRGIPANVWRQPMRIRKNSFRLALITATVTLLTLAGVTQAQAAAGPYTALGDSYSSGVGTRNYYADSGSCYRGPAAYPVQ